MWGMAQAGILLQLLLAIRSASLEVAVSCKRPLSNENDVQLEFMFCKDLSTSVNSALSRVCC
ncbi:hypothetical protein PSPTOT1_3562 [Pseudomonas syringae pv. tomato T1]|nr:hypothetical protein PSPTOT1_3562 [Pseudomonas syringae pv. tomato T1]